MSFKASPNSEITVKDHATSLKKANLMSFKASPDSESTNKVQASVLVKFLWMRQN
ncbi:unnamed protein product [Arabidopsis halleri]